MLSKYIKIVLVAGVALLTSGKLYAQAQGFEQTDMIKVSGVTTNSQVNALPLGQIQTTRVFIDGLGRPVQTVALQASPVNNKDIVQPQAYNTLGQQTISYLPYADNSTVNPIGSFRATAINDQLSYYTNSGTSANPNAVANETSAPFSQQLFENSPLQREVSAGMTGGGFQPTVSGNKFKTVSYRLNNSTQDGNIMLWTTSGTYTLGTNYADNTLYVADGIDEDGFEARNFIDAAGRLILKRQLKSGANVDTYYVYNIGGALSYIIPPQALASMVSSGNYSLSAGPVNTLIFVFTYDSMSRVVEKTVPAKGKINVVYDPMNRPVLVQDPNLQANNKWTYIKYDVKGRAINQGIYTDATNTTRAAMQTYVNSLASGYSTTWYESRSISGTYNFYTNNVFPTTNITPLAYAYFDDYDVDNNGAANFSYVTQGLSGEQTPTTAPVKGIPTAITQTTVGSGVTSNEWFTKVTFYDKRGNPIQTQSNNHMSYTSIFTLTDISTLVPDFVGVPQITKISKKSSSTVTTTVQTNFTYDYFYRLKAVDQYYNGSAVSHVATYTYNEMGQMVKKSLGYVSATSWLQNVDMRYNIRGMLTSINNSTLTSDAGLTNNDSNDVFGINILYDQVDSRIPNSAYFNGRVSAVRWMSKDASGTASAERSYTFTYDGLQQLANATYQEKQTGNTGFTSNLHGFDEIFTYDIGGNISSLVRNASTQNTNSYVQIDNLAYTYNSSSPYQLQKVTDGTDANHTGLGFQNLTGNTTFTYSYDGNGNMTIDPNKGLTLAYNVLNKTDKITMSLGTNRWIDYTYDAGGHLIRKRQFDNNTLVHTTDYIDRFLYFDGTLQYFAMPDGRVLNTGTASAPVFTQEYVITDQQGNARVSFQNNGSNVAIVKQENSYYPSGLIMPHSPVATPTIENKQLYNGGSEWQKDFSNSPDYYETFYRNYDAALARFIAVDPKAESAESLTTYNYASNNPVMFNDPLGDVSEAQWNFVLNQYYGGITGNYYIPDEGDDSSDGGDGGGGGGGGGGGTSGGGTPTGVPGVYEVSDAAALAHAAEAISKSNGWGNTVAGNLETAYNNLMNGTAATPGNTISSNTGFALYVNHDGEVGVLYGSKNDYVVMQKQNNVWDFYQISYDADEKGNGYKEGIFSFQKNQAAFLPAEGIGAFGGSYSIFGTIAIGKNANGQWVVSINASGLTPASAAGNVSFSGNAQLIVNGTVTSTQNFSYTAPNGPTFSVPNSIPLGVVQFNLPDAGSVQIRINAGYSFYDPGNGGSAPIPGQTHYTYTVPTSNP